jgi:hypothetical protein
VRDWLSCIAIFRALGHDGRADAGALWRLATSERKLMVADLRSAAESTLAYLRIERRRKDER